MMNSEQKNKEKEAVINIEDLQIKFGSLEVLKGISLQLYKGENLVVLGKSGTGKSVLIKCIIRLLQSDQGQINVLGEEVNSLKSKELDEMRKQVGFLFQSGALYDSMTVRQNLEFPLRRIKKDLSEKEIEDKVKEVLENVGLPDSMYKMPSELSGGMKKRISLARTIIVDPSIILYDEPTTGLDPVTSHEISLLINDIQKKYKTSSIIITHDIECARTVANRIIMLQDGVVYKEGNLEEFENTSDELVNSYFQNQNTINLNKI
ncbi:ABC transporter ATP-binding protein [Flavobacterium sp.]|uniref:ABC transporter ATP-binding protein n=1 Tax=Flavobacterium sp. TaxID=239 RepID=UPI002B4B906C|nr:ATP-binding cassette domain-containing protein [Flavobacterium sp.]HLF51844.1 ATP-binding cassette domain-containing protein [Flavobacterium sp.]